MTETKVNKLLINTGIALQSAPTRVVNLNTSALSNGQTVTLGVPATDITLVGTTNVQTIQNKIIDATNTVTASAIKVGASSISISGTPLSGQALVYDGTNFVFQTVAAAVPFYRYNNGAVTVSTFNGKTVWTGTAPINTGTAIFQVTTNGTAGGTAIFTDWANVTIQATARNNTSTAIQVPVSSIRNVTGNTVTINNITGLNMLLLGNSVVFANAGSVELLLIGN